MTTSTADQHLYLVRHGQTALNAEGRLRGLANPPLDKTGVEEALDLARALAVKEPTLVVSSPLERALHTAEIIAEIAGARHEVDERFNDRDYGPQTGEPKTDVIARWGSVDAAPGVEPSAVVLARARPALDDLLDREPGAGVVVVTHDAVIRPLIADINPAATDLTAPTGSWNDLLRSGGIWSVLRTDQKPKAGADQG